MWTFECLTRFHVRFAASRILMIVYRSAIEFVMSNLRNSLKRRRDKCIANDK